MLHKGLRAVAGFAVAAVCMCLSHCSGMSHVLDEAGCPEQTVSAVIPTGCMLTKDKQRTIAAMSAEHMLSVWAGS
jgi:hypothetical protein